MIEYPGFVKNVDKALSTMGGLDTIDKISRSEKDRLELKFRKKDPLSHPAYGDRTSKKCLVFRLRRNKNASSQGQDGTYTLSVIGKVQTSYSFETLAEFQWLPMQRTNMVDLFKTKDLDEGVQWRRTQESLNPQYASILDDILPIKNPFDSTLKQFNPDAPLLLLPAIFSRFDTPRDVHQYQTKFRSKEMREEFDRQQRNSIIGRTRKKRSTMTYLLTFGDTVPLEPPEKLVQEREALSNYEHSLVPRLRDCFARQKVWSKAAICYELHCTLQDVKYALPLVAYHWVNGPFRTMWCEYGYDPHQDKSSKTLQTLDFRIKNPLDQQEYSRRSMHQYQLPMRKNPEIRTKKQLDLKSVISNVYNPLDETLDDTSAAFKDMEITEAMCKFRRDLVPPARQLSYQLKDIELEEVQAIVHSNDGREPPVCSKRDGWLRENSIDEIRKIMVKSLRQTIETMTNELVES
jgi:general transcription factor 3C polypeptide 5 (transcription factor C subunit 1)